MPIKSPSMGTPAVMKNSTPKVNASEERPLRGSAEAQAPTASDMNVIFTSESATSPSCARLTPPISMGIAAIGNTAVRSNTIHRQAAAIFPSTTS